MRPFLLHPLAVVVLALGASGTAEACPSCSAIDASFGFLRPLSATAPMSPGLKAMVDAALADAAQRTGRAASDLKVLDAVSLVWPDGSIGCAEPGISYTMAPVAGYRIRIRAGDQILAYHGRDGGPPMFCPPGRGGGPLPGGTT